LINFLLFRWRSCQFGQIIDDENARISSSAIRDAFRQDIDDHWPESKLLCFENTQNMLGGIRSTSSLVHGRNGMMGILAHDLNIKCHVDGARIFKSVVALGLEPKDLCKHVDSISICLSKGLGAPVGSVLVEDTEFIRLAKRVRKRCGGVMRQVSVIASMGLFTIRNNVSRLSKDHPRAQRIGSELISNGFFLPRNGQLCARSL
jgi:threonine aldolase